MKTFTPFSLSTSAVTAFLLGVILLCEISYSTTSAGTIYTSSIPHQWHYNRVKRQLYREEIPHHRPLTGNIYAEHHGFPHPGRWHANPQGILAPNPNSGHHFDDPNVIITDDDFNRYGSTLQHLDNQNHYHQLGGAHPPAPAQPLHHPPPLPQAFGQGQGQGYGNGVPLHPHLRKRRPIKILVHHQVHPPKPHVQSYPVEYGKLIPIEGGGGGGAEVPVIPIIAAHHHQNLINNQHESPALSYAQEYKNIANDHDQKAGLPLLKVKSLFHRLKLPYGFTNKFSNVGQVPILKTVFPIRYGAHDDRGKNGAFSWSVAY